MTARQLAEVVAWLIFDTVLWLALCVLTQSCAHVPHSPCLVEMP